MQGFGFTVFLLLSALLSACSKQPLSPGLKLASQIKSARGKHFVRAITHFHTPYSFDACDGKGYHSDGSIDLSCLHDAKAAFCENHIDFIFNTDHVEHLAETDYARLLLTESGDTPVLNSANVQVGTQIHCPDGFAPITTPGLEGQLLALGLERHVPGDLAARKAIYGGAGTSEKAVLETAGALVAVPHTESRDTQALIALQPDLIEIYNLHANVDPKIRKRWLGKNPFDKIGKFLNYLVDPYNSLHADYIFTDILEFSDIYFEKWNALLTAGLHVVGVGGLDSHQNIFSQRASDGQRLDSHRRMSRFFNNFVRTANNDVSSVKAALKAGDVYFVVEGLGTPDQLDFHGIQNGSIVEMGETLTVVAPGTSSLNFTVPSVQADFPGMDSGELPEIWAELHFIDAAGKESVVKTVSGSEQTLVLDEPAAGNYRVHAFIKPHHLKKLIFDETHADETWPWIVSNVIRVVR